MGKFKDWGKYVRETSLKLQKPCSFLHFKKTSEKNRQKNEFCDKITVARD